MVEDDDLLHGPNRVCYRQLYKATQGFREENLLGSGGFGRVYRGTLPKASTQVAVKKISNNSFQGFREFAAEITTMSRLRHKNLVSLVAYCRRKEELLLVYEHMENGSADKFLYGRKEATTLSWEKRFRVAKGVAEGLLYLHEGWEQLVVHGDVKASNVLLDADFNAHLGDFGLAKLYDRTDPHNGTTHFAGTIGYMAPEMWLTGKATTFSDVYAFGIFLVELVSGCPVILPKTKKEAIEFSADLQPNFLLDEILKLWTGDNLMGAIDSRLGGEYKDDQVETLLKLGILCCRKFPKSRPTMRQVVQILEGHLPMPSLPPKTNHLQTKYIEFVDGSAKEMDGNFGENHLFGEIPFHVQGDRS